MIKPTTKMASIVNNYKPSIASPEAVSADAFRIPYDLNCSIAVPTILENERVAIVPFVPSFHAELFFEEFRKSHAEVSKYLPIAIGDRLSDFVHFVETKIKRRENAVLFAIIDKTKAPMSNDAIHMKIKPSGRIAGIIGWINIAPSNFSLEIGPVIILPEFQGTFVSANAIGLALKHLFESPIRGGLGFRRVSWGADPRNGKSVGVAEKLGFKQEGTLRWFWVMPQGRAGKPVSSERKALEAEWGRPVADGRDSVMLSISWDDWTVGGVEEIVDARMNMK
jgi:RimJ/RimL family protein N-acetyltransferase